MEKYSIAVIGGDGIGPEVTSEAVRCLCAVAEADGGIDFHFDYLPWSCKYYLEHGKMMPDDGLSILSGYDAILLGAVGMPGVPDNISAWELLLKIRHEFNQYVNLRPVKLLRGAVCPLKSIAPSDINMTVVRENSEGEYAGVGSREGVGTPDETARQISVFTRSGTERIMRYAFETARAKKQTLTSISKGNALNYSMVFWDEIFRRLAAEYPDVSTSSVLVDAAAMFFVKNPKRFQVVVASNLFGDILTDLGAAIAGGMGVAAGANINPERRFPSMFEPVHGSAPDIAGKGIASPLAAIWSASQLLDHLGRPDLGEAVLSAIETTLCNGSFLTPDMGGNASTREVGEAVAAQILVSK